MNSRHLLLAIAVVFVTVVGLPATAHAADYHHMHLTAPDAKVAAAWYIQHMGCEDFGREGACRVGTTDFYWFEREPTDGSVGSGVNHIGFSFTDLAAKMAVAGKRPDSTSRTRTSRSGTFPGCSNSRS